jgi:hypothetical protein
MTGFSAAFSSSFALAAGGALPFDPSAAWNSTAPDALFAGAGLHFRVQATVLIGAVDVSDRLTGEIVISGEEDAARTASLALVPTSAAALLAFDGQPITIDLTIWRGAMTTTIRRFTGKVERVEFNAGQRVASLSCRDAYQDTIKGLASAAAAQSLLGGKAEAGGIVKWNDETPDPEGYYNSLLATLPGACAIDGGGTWRVVDWLIATPSASFGPGDVFSDSVTVSRPPRSEMPESIQATLNFRYYRLYNAEKAITWSAPDRARYVVDGLPTLPKSTVQSALSGLNGWLVKGTPTITEPLPGSYPVIVAGQTVYYQVSYEAAAVTCAALDATLYRRWYQQVQVGYSVLIPMGGLAGVDDAVAVNLASTFDASAWETTPTSQSSVGIYQANAPTQPVQPTGYEGLPLPFPAANAALDWHPDISPVDLNAAARHVVALALRKASAGRRKQTVSFTRPLDPRGDIGAVLAISAYGVSATGQVVSFEDRIGIESGDATSSYTLACPDGSGSVTGYSASITPPSNSVAVLLTMPALDTHVGASYDTPAVPVEDQLLGFLCNVLPTSSNYDASKPVYEPQFRLIMPEISHTLTDPLELSQVITATVSIAGSGLTVIF